MKTMTESNILLNVLCLEDVLKDAELLNELLVDAGYLVNMDVAAKEKEYLSFLKSRNYDVILADYTLPGFNAPAALQLALKLQPEVPFICVSGTIGEEKAVELLKQGATDYVLKDRPARLVFAVRQALDEVEQRKKQKRAEAENLKLMHELEVHQIELERQNEKVMLSKNQAELASEKYTELYDFAPSGYFILSPKGVILELNLAGAEMLGKERSKLKNAVFSLFVSPYSKSGFGLFLTKVFENKNKESCEVLLQIDDNLPMYVFLSGRIVAENETQCFITVIDITEYKKLEEEKKQALEMLRTFATMLQNNREEERKSIAREIHDEFGQVLTAIKMNLSMLEKETTKTVESSIATSILSEIDNMKQIINQTIHKVRVFTNNLRPDVLDNFGLFEALDVHITEFDKLHGIKCNFVMPDEEIEIDSDKSIAIYRIVQETLTNVARHAMATEVDISISKQDNFLNVSIEDNGKGIERAQLNDAKSFGIIGMKERAYICGGTLLLTSEPGKGTKIDLSMPIKEND